MTITTPIPLPPLSVPKYPNCILPLVQPPTMTQLDTSAHTSGSNTHYPNGSVVPIGTGRPTRAELLVHYPSLFTWSQLKTFIATGDLGLLKRDKKLQTRYVATNEEIAKEWGSLIKYLKDWRLQWGKRDARAILKLSDDIAIEEWDGKGEEEPPACFTRDINPRWISVICNDWPYSVPPDIEHALIWTAVPIFHSSLIHPSITARIEQDGIRGFTGMSPSTSPDYLPPSSPPPSPTLLPTRLASALPALSAWGVTMDKLIVSPRDFESKEGRQKEEYVRRAGEEVHEYVKKLWKEEVWETAWFVNPPRLQSVPGLAHIHVFARRKGSPSTVNGLKENGVVVNGALHD